MPGLVAPFAFAAGAALGSFLNVVILRSKAATGEIPPYPLLSRGAKSPAVSVLLSAPPDKGGLGGVLTARSRCPRCRAALRWFELIPLISFTLQRGQCRRCRQPISVQYPSVELGMGIAVLLLFSPPPASLAALIAAVLDTAIVALLIILFVIDLKTFLLPDLFIILLSISAIARVLIANHESLITNHLLGSILGSGLLALLWLATRGRGIGLGDVKLMIPLGLLFGPSHTAILLLLAFVAGGLMALSLLAAGRVTMKTAVPFGPFLAGAALAFLLVPPLPGALLNML